MSDRREKMSSWLRDVVSAFTKARFGSDVLVSVTRILMSEDLKSATVFITVFPEQREEEILEKFKKEKKDLAEHVKKNFRAKFLPVFEIKIDHGEKAQQKMDILLGKI